MKIASFSLPVVDLQAHYEPPKYAPVTSGEHPRLKINRHFAPQSAD